MPEADANHTPPRRTFLGHLTGAVIAGTIISTGAQAEARPEPDATLLRFCSAYHSARAYENQCDAACDAADNNSPTLENQWLEALDLRERAQDLVLRLSPVTMAGLRAKARVARDLIARYRMPDEALALDQEVSDRLLEDVLNLLGSDVA